MSRNGHASFILATVFLLAFAAIMAAPLLWMVFTSLQPDVRSVFQRPPGIPFPPAFRNYVGAWESAPFGIYTFNSFFVSLSVTVLQVANAAFCAYAFSKLTFRHRDALFVLVLVVMMVPVHVAIVPLYSLLARLGWLDTYQGLILPFAADAFGIFLARQYFLSI